MFQDIENKGATRNYNTKPSEKANGPLKKYYQRHTNFKNVAKQVRRALSYHTKFAPLRLNV